MVSMHARSVEAIDTQTRAHRTDVLGMDMNINTLMHTYTQGLCNAAQKYGTFYKCYLHYNSSCNSLETNDRGFYILMSYSNYAKYN